MDIQEKIEVPQEWYCPISQEIMKDPVIASDGFTYERKQLQTWFAKSNVSPITGAHLANLNIIPNYALKHTIENFLSKHEKHKVALKPKPKPKSNQKYQIPDLQLSIDSAVSQDDLYVRCQIKPSITYKGQRNPCSIICILDVSQSMDTDSVMGGKDVESHGFSRLDLVKHSINTMVEFMQDNDQIALVSFSTSAKIALNSTRTTLAGKKLIRNTVQNLSSIGTTNIWDGFKVSIEILKQLNKRHHNHNIFMVLLTDGEPNLNPPRGIVPTLIKFLDLEKVPRPNIHTFGYGYELDTNLLTEIAQVGHGTYTYIPDCSMVGTAFVNFMATALSTITNNLIVKFENIQPKSEFKQVIGHKKVQKNSYNLGIIQYGQSRQIVLKLSQRILTKVTQIQKIADIQIQYGNEEQKTTIKSQIKLQIGTKDEESMKKSILRSKYLLLLNKLMRTKKGTIDSSFKQVDEFYKYIELVNEKQSTQFSEVLLKQLKNPVSENEGQVSKAFEKEEWFEKWGKHYIPSLYRAHLMQACTNFKDPALQLYGGEVFEQNRTKMDTIFIKMAPPQPTAKKVAMFVYKPAPFDMADYYNYQGGCIHADCLVQMQNGTKIPIHLLKKGDITKSGIIQCMIKTNIYDWVQMVRINSLIITPWHPVRINSNWVFPAQYPGAIKEKMFIESYYNFVIKGQNASLTCQGIQCIGLGHGINDNPVTAHEYFSSKVLDDLKRGRGWDIGEVTVKKQLRDPINKKIIKMQVQ